MNVLEVLLSKEKPKLPEKKIKSKRLSKEYGCDIEFSIRALSFEEVKYIERTFDKETQEIHIILNGLTEPNLKSKELMDKYGAVTPEELVKKIFLAGEIVDISRAIERLTGYRIDTIEDVVKKN